MIKPIIIFDSGIGGLPYLSHLRERIPWENFIYIADSMNFPYGDKTEENLKKILTQLICKIITEFKPKAVVIACNTASVTALSELRALVDVPIVGVVPAIKTAAEVTKNRRIGILATKRTVEGSYLKNLISEFSSENKVFLVGASEIVKFVENDFCNLGRDDIINFISKSVAMFKEYNVDSVVLGCTHFIHVAKEINFVLGEGVKIVDSREGVSKQTEKVISLDNNREKKGLAYFYMTKIIDNCNNYRILCKNSGIEFRGEFRS